ncbi:MAG: ABC transporter permease subunit [Acidimicrobiia bacterium]|nr:ABC transporter permease subunit [Acidimicrobiia bacterium]
MAGEVPPPPTDRRPRPADEAGRASGRRSLDPRIRDWILRIGAVVFFIGVWTFLTNTGLVNPTFMPSPQRVVEESQRFIENGDLLTGVLSSSRRVIIGFVLASAFSVPLGIVLGVWQPAKAFFDPIISLLRPLPSITWIPLTMLWLGIGEVQKYAIVFMGTWIYVLLYTMEATKRVDPTLIQAARNLGASRTAIMREVVLPGSFPGIISGLKVTLAISWSCVLSAELVAANEGLGALIWQGKDFNNLALVLVGMAAISVTVLMMDVLVRLIEDRLLPWERHRRS